MKKGMVLAVTSVTVAGVLAVLSGPARSAFPGMNGLILFESDNTSSGEGDLFVVNPDGTGLEALTDTPEATERYGRWSPSGSRIVFVSDRDGDFEVQIMYADGSKVRNLTRNGVHDLQPAWSPSERRIAFVSERRANFDLYVMRADGRGLRLVADLATDIRYPDWSPSGKRIAFAAPPQPGERRDVFTVRVDGSGLRNITKHPAEDQLPSWSPDGTRLVFSSARVMPGGEGCPIVNCGYDLFVIGSRGGQLEQLTSSPAFEDDPAWSPDGSAILFESNAEDPCCTDVYVVNLDGTNMRKVAGRPGFFDDTSDWQPIP